MVAGRVLQALGACTGAVLARAIARDLFEGATLARTLSLTMVAMAAAPGFSPLMGGLVASSFGWRASFLLVGILGAILGAFVWLRLAETHPADRRAPVSFGELLGAYGRLAIDPRFFVPAWAAALSWAPSTQPLRLRPQFSCRTLV